MLINNHFVKVIFPFQYSGNAGKCLERATYITSKGKTEQIFERFGFDNSGLRRGVVELFSANDNASRILECFRITYNSRAYFKLPRKKNEKVQFFCREGGQEKYYEVGIEDICLYLFETGIGFIELEVHYVSTDIKDYMDCNYFLCEVKSEKNFFVSKIKSWNEVEKTEEILEVKFTVKNLLADVLRYIPEIKDFYTQKEWEKTSEKGILYSYLYLNKEPEAFQDLLFNVRNNYKQSYKAPNLYEKIREDSHILQLFQNSYWCASYNAAVNVSIETDNTQTNNFFQNAFYPCMRNAYFILFLSALHQRYLVIKLQCELDKVEEFALDYDKMKKQLEWAQEFQTESTKYRLRAFYKQPSSVEHINLVYEFFGNVYRLDELYAALTIDLDNLERVCGVYVDRIQARMELEKKYKGNQIEIFAGVFGLIIGAISLFNDSLQFIDRFLGKRIESLENIVVLVTVFLLVPSLLVITNSISNLREMKKIRKELEEENRHTNLE